MELFALLKALPVLAFVAAGSLKTLQWVLIITGVVCALLALRRRRSPVMLTTGIVLLAAVIWLATIPLSRRTNFFGEPGQYATMRQREEARKACEAEFSALPDRFPMTSLVDEAGGLQEQSVIRLLTQRQLDFVEIGVSGNPDEAKIESYRSFATQLPRVCAGRRRPLCAPSTRARGNCRLHGGENQAQGHARIPRRLPAAAGAMPAA